MALTTKREPGLLPRAVVDVLDAMEDEGVIVRDMMVVRTPVQEYVCHLMDVITIGKYSEVLENSPYDGMFHLSLLINMRYKLEKNEVITLSDNGANYGVPEGSETMAVHLPCGIDVSPPIRVRRLLHNARDCMGHVRFSNYCAATNNCQDFILAVLDSNDLSSPALVDFIKQDANEIFGKLPSHAPIVAEKLTDVAAICDKLREDIVVTCREKSSMENTAKIRGEIVQTLVGKKSKLSFFTTLPSRLNKRNS